MKPFRIVSSILIFLLSCSFWTASGKPRRVTTEIFFRQGLYRIDPQVDENRRQLDSLSALLHRIETDPELSLERVDVRSFASPEGGKTYNDQLTWRRTVSMSDYLESQMEVPDTVIARIRGGIGWTQLRRMVLADSLVPYRDEVLRVLDEIPEERRQGGVLLDSRNHQLMKLRAGIPYRYMMSHLYPQLRYSSVSVTYWIPEPPICTDTIVICSKPDTVVIIRRDTVILPPREPLYKPLFAVKTNLLYDLALTPNVEIEVPIGRRWSVNGEFMRGWWLRKHTFCWELEGFGVEARYWFGDREKRRVLTGWFAGVFGLGGFYDFQFHDDRGVQGEYYTVGLSGGYGMQIAQNWSIEFSAGVGYFVNDYRRYKVEDDTFLVRTTPNRHYESVLPVKAKISLVWLLNRKIRKGGMR